MTIFGATGADILPGRVAVIVAQLLAGGDIPPSDNPDGAPGDVRCTVRITGMVDVAGLILPRLAINIVALIEGKNIGIARSYTAAAFFFVNLGADILDDPEAFLDKIGRASCRERVYVLV